MLIFRLHTRGLRTRSDSRAAERRFRLDGGGGGAVGVVDGWRGGGGGCAHWAAGMYGGYNVVVEKYVLLRHETYTLPHQPSQPPPNRSTRAIHDDVETAPLLSLQPAAATRPATLQRNADTAPAFLPSPRFLETRSRRHVLRVAIPQACSNTREGTCATPDRVLPTRCCSYRPLFAQFSG